MPDKTPKPPRVIAVPSDRAWFDPRLLTAATSLLQYDYQIQTTVKAQIAVPNPSRIAIAISADISATSCSVGPWPDVDAIWMFQPTTTQPTGFFNLFQHGLIVCNQWWVLSGNPGMIRVNEWIREVR